MKTISMKRYVRWCIAVAITMLFIGTGIAQASLKTSSSVVASQPLSNGTSTLNPTDDSYVSTTNPDQNNNNLDYMAMRNIGTGHWMCAGVIKFDVSSVPANAIIISATLNLFYRDWMDNDPAGRTLSLQTFQGDWSEETITNNNMPSFNSQVSATCNVPSAPGVWMTANVTDDVQKFVAGTLSNYGWIIKDDQYWGGANIPSARFYCKEHGSSIPYLEINTVELKSAVLIGRMTNLVSHGSYYTFDAVKLRDIQFSPFSFNTYTSGEKLAVTKQMGILTTNFAFGFFKAAVI
jgi:hypothetical protein